MSSTDFINLYNMIFATILPITSSIFALSKVIAPEAFTKYKNPVLEIPSQTISSHITIDNVKTIWIHK